MGGDNQSFEEELGGFYAVLDVDDVVHEAVHHEGGAVAFED